MTEVLEHKIAEGKTKIIWDVPGTNEVVIQNTDAITAGDGARRDSFPGKGRLSTHTTVNCFELLKSEGIPTHYLGIESEDKFRAEYVNMIPIELVARRIAYGSYLDRNPTEDKGRVFNDLVMEFFSKDDPNKDPIIAYDFWNNTVRRYAAKKPITGNTLLDSTPIEESPFGINENQARQLRSLTTRVFEIFEEAWTRLGVTLVDLKIECGFTSTGDIVVADCIDNDNWRIWPDGDPSKMKDKQLFRDGNPISTVAESYSLVAQATDAFTHPHVKVNFFSHTR